MKSGEHASLISGLVFLFAGGVLLIVAVLFLASYMQQPRVRAPMGGSPAADAIAGWMTLRYVSRAYDVPEPLLLSALDVTEQDARGQSLDQIAHRRNQSVEETVLIVRSTVEQYRGQSSGGTAPAQATAP